MGQHGLQETLRHSCRDRVKIAGCIQHGDAGAGVLCYAPIVDVPVPTEPPAEAVLKSDRATRDQVTGLRLVGSRDDLSLTSLLCLPYSGR